MLAMEFVEVSLPCCHCRQCRVTVPWAASDSTEPSGASSTEDMRPSEPYPWATQSLCTSPSQFLQAQTKPPSDLTMQATISSMRRCSYQIFLASNSFLYLASQMRWKISLKRPSYCFRMVFLLVKQSGYCRCRANRKQLSANYSMLSSVLYMASPTPPFPQKRQTSVRCSLPLCPRKTTSKVPGSLTVKSVALYWSPKACLPMMMGFFQPGTSLGTFLMMMGSRKTVPLRMLRMVPLGLFHIFLRPNSLTRASSGVMVAHLMPTLCFMMAQAASTVTLSSVASRFSMPRSQQAMEMSRKGRMSSSFMAFQMILVISSPSISTTGFTTLILSLCIRLYVSSSSQYQSTLKAYLKPTTTTPAMQPPRNDMIQNPQFHHSLSFSSFQYIPIFPRRLVGSCGRCGRRWSDCDRGAV